MTSPNDIITLYLSDNQNIINEIELIQSNINNNNSIISTKTFKNKYEAMKYLIIKNHYLIQNNKLNEKIKILINRNINEKRRKFKILVLILDDILMSYFNNNKNRTKDEEFIYLAAFAIKNKMYHLIPNVNNDIFLVLLESFKDLIKKLNINIDIQKKINFFDKPNSKLNKYKIIYS